MIPQETRLITALLEKLIPDINKGQDRPAYSEVEGARARTIPGAESPCNCKQCLEQEPARASRAKIKRAIGRSKSFDKIAPDLTDMLHAMPSGAAMEAVLILAVDNVQQLETIRVLRKEVVVLLKGYAALKHSFRYLEEAHRDLERDIYNIRATVSPLSSAAAASELKDRGESRENDNNNRS